MVKLVMASTVALAAALALFSSAKRAQPYPRQPVAAAKDPQATPAAPVILDGWGRPMIPAKDHTPAPAPHHDISGIWDPGNLGIQGLGPRAMPEDGKPEHRLPYTPLGLQVLNTHKPSNGIRSVLPGDTNDPVVYCDPQGFPREDLYELRTTQILQMPRRVIILYEFGKIWRTVWTDGRELPKDLESRWFGYSIGKWVDDYTFVVQSSGMDERTWIDRAGRPHSSDLRVEERFHRVDHDNLELTVTIDDPKMYTKPCVALDKLPFKLQSDDFDVREMLCSPSEFAEYNNLVGKPASDKNSR
jgi:hypothetical protein